ncbi:MAG: SufD family Fe-S cluster assembly protein [Candidatus Caldatribacteriota bacterium]|nr:SufD family Fe-S cluster assembly protein [Atribacterota bacterium]MDD4764918.1 SufD family Fe-S cluster assembly protein [Atribacterota bacterium]MDI9596209.1 SufD family Fe-S cluster assembly protein [Atribacterota bacterium]
MNKIDLTKELSKITETDDIFKQPDIAHIFIHQHKVVQSHLLPGLKVDVKEFEDHVEVNTVVEKNTKIEKPVHMCFGMIPKNGIQKMVINTELMENSSASFLAHCAFPNAVDIQHIMNGDIKVGKNARFSYLEKHIHGPHGGVKVYPHATIHLSENAHYYSEFELIKGRAGLVDIKYEAICEADSVLEMIARISGKENDIINIKEIGHLSGERARGFLSSRVAATGSTRAEVYNKLTASAAYARGHVDCTEIIKDNGVVSAIPIVEVSHPKAHITHEAALGSVDSKQLQTLMARGLNENEATDLIIQGLLK